MPVRNGARFLNAALESLAAQTFGDFEIIAIDNGSTDATPEILAGWAAREPRLRNVRITRVRLAAVLNHAAGLARAPLLARLDADDIAFPSRLEAQVRTMAERPELGLLGSAAVLIDPAGTQVGELSLPLAHDAIAEYQRTSSAFIASSTMLRAAVFHRVGGYRVGLNVSEDFDLWSRVSELVRTANLPEAHIAYRVHPGSVTARGQARMSLASFCVAASAEARRADLPEPFTRGTPNLRLALPLLGLDRSRARRVVRLRSIANGLARSMVALPAPASLKRAAFAAARSLPLKALYRGWLTRAHGRRLLQSRLKARRAAEPPGPEPYNPLVSVILPVRNRAASLARAIDGVLAQTYRNLELIVVDDGSDDGSADVAAAYGEALTLVRRPAEGAYAARNAGLAVARGALVAFADSDDAWLPRKLELQVPLMRRERVGLVFGDTIHVAEARESARPGGTTGFRVAPPRRGLVARALAWRNFVPTTTVLVRRSCLDEIGGFPTSSPVSADHLAWYRLALRHELDYVDEAVCLYTFNPDSISFDLGRSLSARMALFSAELDRTQDTRERRLLRRLLFNSALHLALAALRGRAASVEAPLRLASRTAWRTGGLRSLDWGAAFVAHQIWLRGRR